MQKHFLFLMALFFAASCNNAPKGIYEATPESKPETIETAKGELSFLLGYNGKKPGDVGFITNHVVERRLANLMKDSFSVLLLKTKFEEPLVADSVSGLVAAKYYFDKERTDLSSVIIIDARRDIFWVYYYNGDSMVKFTDNVSANPVMPR